MSTDAANPPALQRRRRLRPLMMGVGVGTLISAVIGLVLLVWLGRNPLPIITRSDVEAAARRWEKHGPASYNMDVQVGGRMAGAVHIEVRQGQVTAMTRDGITPSQRRTWEYWTVLEQFETIRTDFDSAEQENSFGAPPGAKTTIRAEFDPQFGYPWKYQRQVRVLSHDLDVEWEVTRFEVVR